MKRIYKEYIINFIRKYDIFITFSIILIAIFILYKNITKHGDSRVKYFTNNDIKIILKDTVINDKNILYLFDDEMNNFVFIHPTKKENIYELQRITNQLKLVKYRLNSHNKAIDYFIVNLYFFIIVQTIFMVLIMILGIVISRVGWFNSNPKLLYSFLICAGFLTIFQLLPKSMELENNLESNKHYYKIYRNIENQIYSYLSTNDKNENFIVKVDELLDNNQSISFDLKQIPFSEFKKQFEEINSIIDDKSDETNDEIVKEKIIYIDRNVNNKILKTEIDTTIEEINDTL